MTFAPSRLPLLVPLALLAACGTPPHLQGPVPPAPEPLAQPVAAQGPLSDYPALSSQDYGSCAVVLMTSRAMADPEGFAARQPQMQEAMTGMLSQAPNAETAMATADAVTGADQELFYAYAQRRREGCAARYPAYARQIGG
ncbi:hypothetical protein [Mangrovicoccus algicola]|uniref:Uncharacterized protein n=1 Tax=Mangrovicoccus algicola TaxID=2771008 RepID=A0A8J6ZFB1_9RHOB|nr:hypothetical protein [Mangrovicoccus algicola]MBE3640466.1 hypothetical protein [Mangrovicoccus algicola]